MNINPAIVIHQHDLKLIECEFSNDLRKNEITLKKNDNCNLKKNMKYIIICSGGCENFNEKHFEDQPQCKPYNKIIK